MVQKNLYLRILPGFRLRVKGVAATSAWPAIRDNGLAAERAGPAGGSGSTLEALAGHPIMPAMGL